MEQRLRRFEEQDMAAAARTPKVTQTADTTSKGMSKSERAQELRQVFSVFDLKGLGEIESRELLGLKGVDWTEEQNTRLVHKMQVYGTVAKREFCDYFEKALSRDDNQFKTIVKQVRNESSVFVCSASASLPLLLSLLLLLLI